MTFSRYPGMNLYVLLFYLLNWTSGVIRTRLSEAFKDLRESLPHLGTT
jgi:hypothetical protein